ncbi:citrulline utilization hydrolase CtlX [Microbacterium sp. MPKO10]|uniref:citrulline utilization hydrolase CtlX n=1 Tax=Microbacterium sp. MPKO10 TaxID=2989818 RepID=UPI002235A724|nr:arginine deiminase-related protein [Microbacterium sp. MPKO10]MCW4457289.1 arginine deiminase-related protein [Microbacterium sp. MPKO10]
MSIQAPRAVVLIRPRHFTPNPATATDNTFQSPAIGDAETIARAAWHEVTDAAAELERHGVTVHLFDDERDDRADAVFPNNWFSTHSGGHVAVYPMQSPSRRGERREDVIELLKREYRVQDVIDYSGLEYDDVFLEGTGAMVLDHLSRIAYTVRSTRADPIALERFCTNFGYEPMAFDAVDEHGCPIYHSNVLMCVATDFAMIGLDFIADQKRRAEVVDRLGDHGRDVIELSREQIREFAGNAIELQGREGRILALSTRALASLTAQQRSTIEKSCAIVPLSVPTIELAGGSVRCMLAGIHLDPRTR